MSQVPHFIRLADCGLPKPLIGSISEAMIQFCKTNAPDLDCNFAEEESGDMSYKTALAVLSYGLFKCRKLLELWNLREIANAVIIRYWGQETGGRDNDPMTGELLENYPIDAGMILQELNELIQQKELEPDDIEWLGMIQSEDPKVLLMLQSVSHKFNLAPS